MSGTGTRGPPVPGERKRVRKNMEKTTEKWEGEVKKGIEINEKKRKRKKEKQNSKAKVRTRREKKIFK